MEPRNYLSKSVAEKYKAKYPSLNMPRYNPHEEQRRVKARLESLRREMKDLGWEEQRKQQE